MRVEAAAISASEPERRLPVPAGDDELVRLATTLNEMLGRLQESLARERRFVDDAAHELRTPLAILNGELELALSRPRTAGELEATIRRASAESDRLARLAEDLLVLARAQEGRLPVHREDVSLGGSWRCVRRGRASASAAGVTITTDAGDRRANVDRVRVRQAVENLLDNAIRHSPAGAGLRVAAAWRRPRPDPRSTTPARASARGARRRRSSRSRRAGRRRRRPGARDRRARWPRRTAATRPPRTSPGRGAR